jgi:hypothetical protein
MSERLAPDDFLSGASGLVLGVRATGKAIVSDAYADSLSLLRVQMWRLRRAAVRWPRRRVLALGVERPDEPNLLARARDELLRSKHQVTFESTVAGELGKFQNLNSLLERTPPAGHDWLLVIDDDVSLPRGFLDAFVFLIERFGLRLAQPAHRARSHAAWQITRRRPGSLVRETPYVEIGPLVAFHAVTFETLLPFPPLQIGWGLDAHWAAVARANDWRLGIVDATPIHHRTRQIAAAYNREEAIAEGRQFLADKPYVTAADAQRTLVTHRSWR